MHSSARRHKRETGEAVAREAIEAQATKGLVLNGGWRYDLMGWVHDTFSFRGQWRELRRRTLAMARVQPGESVLDVGCGTGTLALEAANRVGTAGRVCGIDPSSEQIARARVKAARRHTPNMTSGPIEFQIGVIERLPFPEQTFDVVFSTLMMHHLPAPLKRQGFAEIARVLKPKGRLIIADFTRKQERKGRAARFHAGGSSMHNLAALVEEAGFTIVETEEMRPPRFSTFPGAGFIRARKNETAGRSLMHSNAD